MLPSLHRELNQRLATLVASLTGLLNSHLQFSSSGSPLSFDTEHSYLNFCRLVAAVLPLPVCFASPLTTNFVALSLLEFDPSPDFSCSPALLFYLRPSFAFPVSATPSFTGFIRSFRCTRLLLLGDLAAPCGKGQKWISSVLDDRSLGLVLSI